VLASTRARVGVGILVLLVLASIGTYVFISNQKPAAAAAAATLTIYKGTAQRAPAGSSTFAAVLTGQALNGGDQIRTGAATAAAIRFGDGSVTRLDSNTAITIRTLTHQGSEYQTSFSQSAGKTWNKVRALVGVASFNVTGPNSTTAEVRGTTFVLIIEPNGDVRVDDYQGTVIFHAKAGSVTVTIGQSSTVLNGSSNPQATTGIPAADLQDPFTIFNIAADANLDATGNGDILSVNANNTIAVAQTQGPFVGGGADGKSDLSFTLDWPGSTFELKIVDPDGVEYDTVVSDQHPVTYTVPDPRAGDWSYQVHDISSAQPNETWSVVVGAVRPAKKTPNLFFRGGAKQVCDHTVIGGKADTWSLDARDAAGAPTFTTSQLPDYAKFTSAKGTGTFKFTPPLDVAPADLAITVTSAFAGDTASLTCTEHVIPPKNASVGGTVLSGGSGVSGVLVTLTMPDSSTQISATDGAGQFGFSGLGAGVFTLAVTAPSGYTVSGPVSQTATLDGNTAATPVVFNLAPVVLPPTSSSLGATVLSGTSGVSGVLIVLTKPDGSTQIAYSDSAGKVGFSGLGAGNHTLAMTVPSGYKAGGPTSQTVALDGSTAGAPVSFTLLPFKISLATLPNESVGDPPCTVLTLLNGVAPVTWSVTSGAMPTGTGFDVYGHCNGTPTTSGTFTFTLTATDAGGDSASQSYTITVFPGPIINGPSPAPAPIDLKPWDQGFANPQTLTGTGGIAPYTWSVVSGALPTGLSLDAATGTITGKPDPNVVVPGRYAVGVQLTDAVGAKAFRTVLVRVTAAPVFQASLSDTVTAGQPYSRRLGFSAANPPFTVTTSGLPPGITAAVVGVAPNSCDCSDPTRVELTGTPSAGAYKPVLTLHDAVGGSVSLSGSINVVSPGVSIVETSLPPATLTVPYTTLITPTGGLGGPYTVYVSGGPPPGMNQPTAPISPAVSPWTFSGIPSQCGTFAVGIVVYDNSGSNFSTLTLTVGASSTTICSPLQGSLPGSDVGVTSYSIPLVAAGGTGPYTWRVSGGPPDLVVSGSTLTVKPTGFTAADINPTGGPWNITVVATDSGPIPTVGGPIPYQLQISPAPILNTPAGALPRATGGAFYQTALSVTGNAPTGLELAPGSSLPPGFYFTLSNQCLPPGPCIEGYPTTIGTYPFSLLATDNTGGVGAAPVAYTLTIDPPPTPMTFNNPSPLFPSMVGASYADYITVSGGMYPYGFTVSAGTLPPGLALDQNSGQISGTPTTAGTYSATIQVTDGGANPPVSMAFTIVIDPTLSITTTLLPGGSAGQAYSQPVLATGGAPGAYSFSLAGVCDEFFNCTYANNLQIDPITGVISSINTPVTGTETFRVYVKDSDNNQVGTDYSIFFGDPTAIVTTSLPNAGLLSGYCQTLSARGGTPAYTWSLSSGSLPTGVVIDSYGHLTGTPTVAGTYTFTVMATDTNGQTATQSYTVTIA
jgi:Putative Ig domain/FecR protein